MMGDDLALEAGSDHGNDFHVGERLYCRPYYYQGFCRQHRTQKCGGHVVSEVGIAGDEHGYNFDTIAFVEDLSGPGHTSWCSKYFCRGVSLPPGVSEDRHQVRAAP